MRGLALVSLLGLMLLLVLAELAGLKPWENDSVEPRLALPVFEASVGDAVALPSGPVAFVADSAAAPVGAGSPSPAARRPSEGDAPEAASTAVGPGRAVAVTTPTTPAPAPGSGKGDKAPSVEPAPVPAPPEGTSSPVTTPPSPDPGNGPGRPIPSGGPVIESCDGDEYVITIVIDPEVPAGEEGQVEIVLKRFNADGTVDELELEGDVLDAQNLALQLSSEGNCVIVEAAPPEASEAEGEAAEADPDSDAEPPAETDAP